MNNYFVSFTCGKNRGLSFGNITFSSDKKFNRKFLEELKEHIEKKAKVENVVILNIINLDNL